MIDFVGRSRSPLDDAQQWNQYFTQDHARAQQEWQDREVRRRYDETTRYNREGAISDSQFINSADVADTFQPMDGQLAGLHVEDNGTTHVAPPAADTSTANTSGGAPTTTTTPIPTQPRRLVTNSVEGPISFVNITPQQRAAIDAYAEAAGGNRRLLYDPRNGGRPVEPNPQAMQRAQERLRSLGLEYRVGGSGNGYHEAPGIYRITRRHVYSDAELAFPAPGTPRATAAIPPAPGPGATPGSAATADAGDPAALDETPNSDANAGGLEPPNAYQGTNDTSGPLRSTREMRMLETNVQDSLRRADLAARHGDRAGAQAALAQAMQFQAAYVTQGRQVLYHAAAAGSMDAMRNLLAEFQGVDPNTLRLQPTDERRTRFVMQRHVQRRRPDGTMAMEWVTGSETPHTRNEILGGLENLIDAAGATARTEAATELMHARITAGAQITVASMEQQTAIRRMLTDAQIAQWNNQARAELEAGRGQFQVDQDGGVWFAYSMPDAQGHLTHQMEHVQIQDVQTPTTQGTRTSRQPVATRVTGITGVTTHEGANH